MNHRIITAGLAALLSLVVSPSRDAALLSGRSALDDRPGWCRDFRLRRLEQVRSIRARALDDLWISTGAARHWDGKAWIEPRHESETRVDALRGDRPWATGATDEGHPTVFSSSGLAFEEAFVARFPGTFTDVWASSADDVWAVGRGYPDGLDVQGLILRRGDRGWNVAATSELFVNAVWGSATNDVWFAGEHGQIRHWDGRRLTFSARRTAATLRCLWGIAGNDAWAAGDDGVILHWGGADWTPMLGGAGTFTDVVGESPSDVWFVGSGGAFHWNGVSLSRARLGPDELRRCGSGDAAPLQHPVGFRAAGIVGSDLALADSDGNLWSYRR